MHECVHDSTLASLEQLSTMRVQGHGHFYSALKAFKTRTCYASAGNDHLVGWGNSSLRFTTQLPDLRLMDRTAVPTAKGVVRADAVDAGFSTHLLKGQDTHDADASPPQVNTAAPQMASAADATPARTSHRLSTSDVHVSEVRGCIPGARSEIIDLSRVRAFRHWTTRSSTCRRQRACSRPW